MRRRQSMRATTTVMSSACSAEPAHCSAAAIRFSATRGGGALAWRRISSLQALHAKFFAVNIFGLGEAVAECDEHASGLNLQRSLRVRHFLEQTDYGSALVELLHVPCIHEKRSEVPGVRIRERLRFAIVNGVKECRVAIIRSVLEQMSIQALDTGCGGAAAPVEH